MMCNYVFDFLKREKAYKGDKVSDKKTIYGFAYDYIGVKEIKGQLHNSVIQKMYHAVIQKFLPDETPWCAAFVGYCLESNGLNSTKKLNARSYLKYGYSISNFDNPKAKLAMKPQAGDIVVLWRDKKDSWKGHVGFYAGVEEENDMIYVLGGNQGDEVNIKRYPISRILDIRRY